MLLTCAHLASGALLNAYAYGVCHAYAHYFRLRMPICRGVPNVYRGVANVWASRLVCPMPSQAGVTSAKAGALLNAP